MKNSSMRLAGCLLALALLCCFFPLSAQRTIDVQHYRYEISLEDKNDTLTGIATIDVKFLQATNQVVLDLVSLKSGKGMIVSRVMSDDKLLVAQQVADSLVVTLPATAKAGDALRFIISYKGIPSDGLIISKNKFGRRTFFADNWPNRAHHWIPCVDDPADKASVEFIVTAPDHYKVVSNGLLVKEDSLPDHKKRTHWKEDVSLPTKVMVIGAADFAVEQAGTAKGIPVSSWVFTENKDKGFYDYAPATGILSFFIDYIGPFPYKKLANVQSKTIFGGMENAGAIFYFENSVNGKRQQEGLIAHEIAHQWFGDMATEKSFSHLWLSEGFATYLTILYMEKTHGADTARLLRAEDREQVIWFVKNFNHPVVDTVSPYMSLLNANSYQKGGWVLHMLRRTVGDSAFHKGIRDYYAVYSGKNADTRDLQRVFEKASGKDLSVFFNQWLYLPGVPKLEIQWRFKEEGRKILVTIRQLQKEAYQFPLDLFIQAPAGRTQLNTLQVTGALQTFSIPVAEKPLVVKADPGIDLLFEGSVKEVK